MRYITLIFTLFLGISLNAQLSVNCWQSVGDQQFPENLQQSFIPDHFAGFHLNQNQLSAALQNVPQEDLTSNRQAGLLLELPMPNGEMEIFKIWETSVMDPDLAARYPQIRSFKGQSQQNLSTVVRISLTNKGFHAAYHTPAGQIYVDPYDNNNQDYYMVYHTKDHHTGETIPSCGFDQSNFVDDMSAQPGTTVPANASTRTAGAPVELRQFRFALGASGEYSQGHGGTVASVLEDFNIVMNRLNLVFEQNLATRFVLVDGVEEIIYLDPDTDPYADGRNGGQMLGENQIVLAQTIGLGNFDIGHVLTGGCDGGLGGIAGGRVCLQLKGAGVTCHASGNVLGITVEIMTHEVGHQLSAGHTWNGCPPSSDQYSAGTAWEPGSGSTIMSYSGSCGSGNNVQNSSDEYFHGGTIDQMGDFIRNGSANCGVTMVTANNSPDVSIPTADGFFIPIRTPFELIAEGQDMDGDAITYCWEQRDLGPFGELGAPQLNAPIFRSLPPVEASNRIFPNLFDIVNNNSNVREILPTYSRDLNFSCTVRDNNPAIGGVSQAYIEFEATEMAGPFVVAFPSGPTTLEVGAFETFTWDVANTDQAPVNCQEVNITMSLDGGFTYPIVLGENVANDGSYDVSIPNEITTQARIKVAAADNIFFDISNANFSIVANVEPGFGLAPNTSEIRICPPEQIAIELVTESFLNFNNTINFSVNELPEGVTAEFSQAAIQPGMPTTLFLNVANITNFSSGSFNIVASADGIDDVVRTIGYESINTDFSALTLDAPLNGAIGIGGSPDYAWSALPNVDYYEIQIASSPTFAENTIIESVTGIDVNSYESGIQLDKGFPYYWRIRPANICGVGGYSVTYAFHTEVQSCSEYVSPNVPVSIPSAGLPVITSTINIPGGGSISDVNVSNLMGDHDIVKHLDVQLLSPAGTSVLLFRNFPCNNNTINIKLDDDAASFIPCPMADGGTYTVEDMDGLAKFNGENSTGEWTLRMEVINTLGDGGSLDNWALEICATVALSGPVLINNEILTVAAGASGMIPNNLLLAEDANNSAAELIYTIIETPLGGIVLRNGATLSVGGTFTQEDINNGLMEYQNQSNLTGGSEQFTFTVADGEGGWLGTPAFRINIDGMINTSEQEADQQLLVFPNPANDYIDLVARATWQQVHLTLYNIHGQKVSQRKLQRLDRGTTQRLSLNQLPAGIYFLQVDHQEGRVVKKLTVQR